jgi:hypothetical protein
MAYEIPGFKDGTRTAGADLSALQFQFVKLGTANTVVAITANTDKPYGILQNTPTSGQAAEVMQNGHSKLVMAASTVEGALIGSGATGKGTAYVAGTDTTKYIVGECVAAAGAANGIGTVSFSCIGAGRGA